MSKRTSDNNSATFLMDGEEFFAEFVARLDEVRESVSVEDESSSMGKGKSQPKVPANTYVRLAYWAMEHHLPLKQSDHSFTMEVALKGLADRGIHVEIILWDPDAVSANAGDEEKNFAKKVARGNKAVEKALHGYKDRVQVFLESHPTIGGVGYGLHQKMALFSIGGRLKALVGGFNMEMEYWDTVHHHGSHPLTGHGHTLHDTAVQVEGPVTCDIEEEWLRRWDRQVSAKSLLFWSKEQAPYKVRGAVRGLLQDQPTDGDLTISVLTTGVFATKTEHSIRDEIKALIQNANAYVYAENYQFFEPEIITEICRKLKTQKQFQVCVVIPDPVCDPTQANTQLSRIAYARMLLASFKEKGGVKGKLDEALRSLRLQDVTDPVNNEVGVYYKVLDAKKPKGWMEGAKLQMRPPEVKGEKTVPKPVEVALELIEGVDLKDDAKPRVQFYCPAKFPSHSADYAQSTKIYVHSKLMLIDSRHVIVGSANFGHRSMHYDGEMSLHINSDAFAIAVKQKLFPHYSVRSLKEVPEALRDDARCVQNEVRLIPRSPGDLRVAKEKLPFPLDYSWF